MSEAQADEDDLFNLRHDIPTDHAGRPWAWIAVGEDKEMFIEKMKASPLGQWLRKKYGI